MKTHDVSNSTQVRNQTKKKTTTSGKPKVSWAYRTDKKHLPYIILTFTLFPIGQSPLKPGGGGATHTMKTHDVSNSTPGRIQTKPNESKPNEKENHDNRKPKV